MVVVLVRRAGFSYKPSKIIGPELSVRYFFDYLQHVLIRWLKRQNTCGVCKKNNYGSLQNLTGLSGLLSETTALSHPELFSRIDRKGEIPSLPTEKSCLNAYQPI